MGIRFQLKLIPLSFLSGLDLGGKTCSISFDIVSMMKIIRTIEEKCRLLAFSFQFQHVSKKSVDKFQDLYCYRFICLWITVIFHAV